MSTFEQDRNRILDLIDKTIQLSRQYNKEDQAGGLEKTMTRLIDGKLVVVVCGEFKKGKSSLINAFLEDPGLFPVDVDVATNAVTTISYAPEEKIIVTLRTKKSSEQHQIERKDIREYVTEQHNRNNRKCTYLLEIQTPNKRLKDGLALVDTPGVGGLNPEHTAMSYAFLPNADAIVYVTDALVPLSSTELEFIEHIASLPKPPRMMFVITKSDLSKDYEMIIESNREKLSSVLKQKPEEIHILPVSSFLKQQYLRMEVEELLQSSNFPPFESQLWKLLDSSGAMLLIRSLIEVRDALKSLSDPLNAELEMLRAKSQVERDEIQTKLVDLQQKYNRLLENNADWMRHLSDGLIEIRIRMSHQYNLEFQRIRAKVNEDLDDLEQLKRASQIARSIEMRVDSLLLSYSQILGQEADKLYNSLKIETELDLNPFDDSLVRMPGHKGHIDDIHIETTGLFPKAVRVATVAGPSTAAASGLGAFIGGVIGGAIGFFAGGGVGAVPGAEIGAEIGAALFAVGAAKVAYDYAIEPINRADIDRARREVSRRILPYLDESYNICDEMVQTSLVRLEQSMREDLINKIKQQKARLESMRKATSEALLLSQDQATRRGAVLEKQLQPIDELKKCSVEIGNAVAGAVEVPQV